MPVVPASSTFKATVSITNTAEATKANTAKATKAANTEAAKASTDSEDTRARAEPTGIADTRVVIAKSNTVEAVAGKTIIAIAKGGLLPQKYLGLLGDDYP